MDKFYRYARSKILGFRLENCCWLAPVRIGVLVVGYYNYITSLIFLVASATESFSPTLKKVQEKLAEEASVSSCILAYGIQLSSAVLLLCAMHRNDAVLLWTYLYYLIFTTALAVIGYGLLIGVIGDLLIVLVIVIDIIFQCYVMLLVRSAIVEIETANNKRNIDFVVKLNDVHTDRAPSVHIVRHVEAQTESKVDVEPVVEERVEINTSANTTEETKQDPGTKLEIKPDAAASVKITEEIKPKPKTKTDAIVKRKIERNTTKTPENTEATQKIETSSKKNESNKQQSKEINVDPKFKAHETKAHPKPDPELEAVAATEDEKPEPNADSTETNKESQAELSKEDAKKANRERRRLFLFNWRAANK